MKEFLPLSNTSKASWIFNSVRSTDEVASSRIKIGGSASNARAKINCR